LLACLSVAVPSVAFFGVNMMVHPRHVFIDFFRSLMIVMVIICMMPKTCSVEARWAAGAAVAVATAVGIYVGQFELSLIEAAEAVILISLGYFLKTRRT